MKLFYSNQKFFNTLVFEFTLLACVFISFAIIAFYQFWLALFFVFLALLSCLIGFLLYKQRDNVYLNIDMEKIIIYNLISSNHKVIDNESIKIIFRRGNLIVVQRNNDLSDIQINLNYLEASDIKKLLLYLSYTPSFKTTFL